jgi:hexosaminidase
VQRLPGYFPITQAATIFVEAGQAEVRAIGEYLGASLRQDAGWSAPVREASGATLADGSITLTTVGADPALGKEGYELAISPATVLLRAPEPRGLFLAVQTLRQLLGPQAEKQPADEPGMTARVVLPRVRIVDQPRYQWRGMLLDCCRHFMPKEFVKRYIDLLAYHKMNVLHWHLTEDQGWRIEIKKYPKLTEVGAWRGPADQPYGGFYTQDDIREVVAYAASRYVTVVPEIEMPGHSVAALASYPELSCTGGPFEVGTRWGIYADVYCAGHERTFEFLQDVLSEVIELFPSEFIHIGGDECPKTRWQQCKRCQARIKAEGLKDEHELQSYFIRRIENFLNGKGKRLIGWDEILEGGLAPNATVQSWRGMEGAIAAATAGHDVIASPTSHCYLDYSYDAISLERIYSFEPTPVKLTPSQAGHVLGAEGNMWTERAPQERVDRQVFPRLCALAEVTWSPAAARDWADFSRRMRTHYRRLDALGVRYYMSPPRCTSADRVFTDAAEVILENPLGSGAIHFTLDGNDPTPTSPQYVDPLTLTESTTVNARTFISGGNASDVARFHFARQRPLVPVRVSTTTSGLMYEYYEGSWTHLPDFDRLTPIAVGTAATFDLAVRKRDDRFALRFAGYLDVPTEGIYTFHLASDDGSRLTISAEIVVEHDGLHSATERSGQIILQDGRHPIIVSFFEAGGSQRLEVEFEGPGVSRQPIPTSALSHTAEQR